MARSAVALALSAVSHSPIASRASMQFATSTVVSIPDALQQQVAQSLREFRAVLVRRGKKLFGEEWIALRAGGDRLRQRRRQRIAGVSDEQRR
jgi:hypothetical protein